MIRSGFIVFPLWIVVAVLLVVSPFGIRLSFAQEDSFLPLDATYAVRGNIAETLALEGVIEPIYTSLITAPFPGVIEDVLARPDVRIGPRSPLVRFSDTTLAEKIEPLQAAHSAAVGERRKLTFMYNQNLISENKLESKRQEISDLALSIRDLEKQKARLTLRTSEDTTVLEVMVTPGQSVRAGSPLIRLGDPERLRVTADIPAAQDGRIVQGQNVLVTLKDPSIDLPGTSRSWRGSVRTVFPRSPEHATARVFIDIVESHRAMKGEDARAEIILDHAGNALLVPRTALVETAEGSALWVVDEIQMGPTPAASPTGNATLRTVTHGIEGKDFVEILSGLNESDIVLLSPPHRMRTEITGSGLPVTIRIQSLDSPVSDAPELPDLPQTRGAGGTKGCSSCSAKPTRADMDNFADYLKTMPPELIDAMRRGDKEAVESMPFCFSDPDLQEPGKADLPDQAVDK